MYIIKYIKNKEELIALNKDCKINWKKIQNCNIFAKDLV